jgi:hypothetical protein
MWDYVIVIMGFLVMIAIKIFLVIRTHDKNKNLYQRPGDLAKDIMKTNKPDVKKFLEDIQETDKLTLLILRNVFLLREHCNTMQSFFLINFREENN